MALSEPIQLATIPRSPHLNAELCERAVEVLGEDGAWLLLSQVWYGWRTYYDLACGVHGGPRPEVVDDSRPAPITTEYQIVVDLQIQGFLYAAAEQFATLLRAMHRHQEGTEGFEAFVGAPTDLRSLVESVADLTRKQIVAMVGDPASAPAPAISATTDPKADVVEVGGLLVPRSVILSAAFNDLVDQAQAMIELAVSNLGELRQFVDPPPPIEGAERQPQPLRAIDNSFRHGLRLLFHEAAPRERTFRVAMDEQRGGPSVDLYLPGRGKSAPDAINYGSVACTENRTLDHLETLRLLATRTGQLARSFLGYQTTGTATWLLVAPLIELLRVSRSGST